MEIVKHRRSDEIAVFATGNARMPAVNEELRAFFRPGLDESLNAHAAFRRDDGPHLHSFV